MFFACKKKKLGVRETRFIPPADYARFRQQCVVASPFLLPPIEASTSFRNMGFTANVRCSQSLGAVGRDRPQRTVLEMRLPEKSSETLVLERIDGQYLALRSRKSNNIAWNSWLMRLASIHSTFNSKMRHTEICKCAGEESEIAELRICVLSTRFVQCMVSTRI